MELKMIVKFDDREIVLTEAEAIALYNKLSGMFGKEYTCPIYPVYPTYPAQPINPVYNPVYVPLYSPTTCEITCVSTETANIPFMREVEPFSKKEMCDIREELEATTTTSGTNETQWVNPSNIKLDGDIRLIDLSYHDALMVSLK